MKGRKTRSKFTIFVLACFVLFASVWAGRTYAYFTASSNANGTITMGTLKFDGKVTAEADTDTSLKVVPNQTVNRTYQAKVKRDIKYYKRVCLTASVDVVSGKTHKAGCGDNVADDMSILDMKIAAYKSIVADEVTYYYVLSPVTPSSSNITTEEFTINLTLKDWVGKGGCDYYMGATINLNVKIEVIQADYLEERGEASAFTDVQTMHDVWTSIFGGESGTPGDDEVHDVSYYSDTLEFKVISEDAKTMSVQKASGTSTASIDPVENTTTGLKKVQNKNVGTSGSTLTIPSQVTKDGVTYTVSTIAGSGFVNDVYTEIKLPNTITDIAFYAFKNCLNLTTIEIPNSVTSIGDDAFYGCSSLNYNTYDNGYYLGNSDNLYLVFIKAKSTSITSCDINNDCKIMYNNAFYNCSSLTSATIPNSITKIARYAFCGCSKLKSITIPNSVTIIDVNAFEECTSLTSITIPESVTTIEQAAFYNCRALTSVTVPDDITVMYGAFTTNNTNTFNAYGSGLYIGNDTNPYLVLVDTSSNTMTGFAINMNCKYIGGGALTNCSRLTSIEIPDNVVSIGERAFEGCTSLSSVTIGKGLTDIGYSAFDGCTALTSIIVSGNGTKLSSYLFRGCSSVISVTFGAGVKQIGPYIFDGCTNLTSVTFEQPSGWHTFGGESINVSDSTTNATNFSKDGDWYNKVLYCDYEETLEGTVLYINGNVGQQAYQNRTDITEVVFGDDVYSIGAGAFIDCANLTSITLGKNVTYIGVMAFGQTSITSLTIPASVKLIDAMAFVGWSENFMDQTLTEYIVESGNPYYKAIDGVLYSKDGKTLISYPYAKTGSSFTIPNGVTTIATGAFAYNQYLTSITMPDSVTVAELSSFFYLPNLTSVSISNNITEFSVADFVSSSLEGAFAGTMWGCLNDNFQFNIYENGYYLGNSSNPYLVLFGVEPKLEDGETALTSLVVHDGCKVIGNWAFTALTNSITSISIPDSVEHIGEFAYTFEWIWSYLTFNDNGKLVTSNLPIIGLTYSDNGLYLGTTNNPYKMLLYVIPDSTKDVLTEFVINSKCEIIGSGAFAFLDETNEDGTKYGAITTINIPASVKYIHTLGLANSTISSIAVDSDNLYYKAVGGVLYSKDGKTLIYYPSAKAGTSFTVSSNVTKVEMFAFLNNPNLITLTIPDTVKSINMVSVVGNVNIETINISGDFMMTNLMGRFILLENYVPTSEVTSSEWLLDNWLGEGFNSSELSVGEVLDEVGMCFMSMCKVLCFDRV